MNATRHSVGTSVATGVARPPGTRTEGAMVLKLRKNGVLLAAAVLACAAVAAGAPPATQASAQVSTQAPARTPVRSTALEPLSDTTDRGFLRELLTSVNNYRSLHGVPPVKLDKRVTRYAKSRARTVSSYKALAEAHKGLDHKYGENLFWYSSARKNRLAGSVAVKEWYDEGAKYDFDAAQFSHATGHFTQLVWKGTTRIGAARVSGKGDRWRESYVVVDFAPPGNVVGAFKENVLPPKADRR